MRLPSLKSVVLILALAGLVVPTGAAVTDLARDDVFEQNGVTLAPYDGPNGEYANIKNGNLTVEVRNPGVNTEGLTIIQRVFVINNTGQARQRVWLTHDAEKQVTLYESVAGGMLDNATVDRRAIQGASNALELDSGEAIVVSMAIDTRAGEVNPGQTLLHRITLHAEQLGTPTTTPAPPTTTTDTPTTAPEPTDTETPSGGGAAPTPAEAPTATQTPEPLPEDETVDVDFGDATVRNVTVTSVDPNRLGEEDAGITSGPTAVIEPQGGQQSIDEDQTQQATGDDGIDIDTVDLVTNEGQPFNLTGTQSYISTTAGVDSERRITKAVDIQVPPDREDKPATVQMRVDRSQFEDDPADARIGRRTEQGWQLLPTKVVERSPDSVLLRAQTPGFSVFAAFSSPEVRYTWTLPNGTTVEGENIRARIDDPGLYNVTLTVTDSFGNSDSVDRQILVNDIPSIEIQRPANVTAGEPVTLRANVSNQFGNATVTWQLPNGSEATGRTVQYAFAEGEHTVEAQVEDGYGANATTQSEISVGSGPSATEFGTGFPVLTWLVVVSLVLLAFMLVRRLGFTVSRSSSSWLAIPRIRAGVPRVTVFDAPLWNADRGRFELGALRVEDAGDDLETVEIRIVASDGTALASKTIEVRDRKIFETTAEAIPQVTPEDISPKRVYTVTVRAVDARDNEGVRTRTIVGSSVSRRADGTPAD